MCEANAYFVKDNIEEKILESVDEVEVEDDTIRMVNIFGEQKMLKARIRRYNSTEGKLLLEPV